MKPSVSSSFFLLTTFGILFCDGLFLVHQQLSSRPNYHPLHTLSFSSRSTTSRLNPIQLRPRWYQQQQQQQGRVVTCSDNVSRLHSSLSSSIHQVDNDAKTLPQLMKSLWALISYASKSMYRGVSLIIYYCIKSHHHLSDFC